MRRPERLMGLYHMQRERDEPSLAPADFSFAGIEPAGLGPLRLEAAQRGWIASLAVTLPDGGTCRVQVGETGRLGVTEDR